MDATGRQEWCEGSEVARGVEGHQGHREARAPRVLSAARTRVGTLGAARRVRKVPRLALALMRKRRTGWKR
ncbi:hypothetical protein GUJ93_ZPchr0002g23347 [Zizania palustris]|uniref:Uncharacterized protein n=1 Tax=Zizania palustris TaxID=103762 RepID=A0A8J5RVC3_ZIZPA|nr:hypothetical protein GUJ93_ZPchr0002g23347 [Zizania palustris]